MNTFFKYLSMLVMGIIMIALLVWFVYEFIKNLPVLLLTLGFIALVILIIILVEKVRN